MHITKLTAKVYSKAQHPMRRSQIPANVLHIIDRLNDADFHAYVVGGCIRDKLFGLQPKDFDVVTDARPEQIKQLFKNCRLIGRRFRLAHLHFGREIIEVATFRGHHTEQNDHAQTSQTGILTRDNVFGSIEEDAARRDFDLNAMYFDPISEQLLDFADGMKALQQRRLTMIGDPLRRITEDPVRMIRAIRFSAKLGCDLESSLAQAIRNNASLLSQVAPARLFEEVNKLFISGAGRKVLSLLLDYRMMKVLFPVWTSSDPGIASKEITICEQMLENTDERVNTGNRTTPAFLYASFLWYALEDRAFELTQDGGLSYYDALNLAGAEVLQTQTKRVMIPKRFSVAMREIWSLQYRLQNRRGNRPFQLLTHPRFRAAYDFLLLRAHVEGGECQSLAQWWTTFQASSQNDRRSMVMPSNNRRKGRKSRNRTQGD